MSQPIDTYNMKITNDILDILICLAYDDNIITKDEFKYIDIELYNKAYIYTMMRRNTIFNNYLRMNSIEPEKLSIQLYIKYYIIYHKQLKIRTDLDNVQTGINNLKRKISDKLDSNKKQCSK